MSDLRHETTNGLASTSYSVTDRITSAYVKVIQANDRLYWLAIVFPEQHRAEVEPKKDAFFGSFAFKPKN